MQERIDIRDLFARNRGRLILLSLICSCAYHIFLAIGYGGFPLPYYPDEMWIISTGLYLVGAEIKAIPPVVLTDKTLMLPLFEGVLYKIFGFPNFLYLLCIWDIVTAISLIVFSYRLGSLYFDDEWTGITAAILIAFNWHIGWYTHRLLPDIAMIAFEFATLTFYLEYSKNKRTRSLLLCGAAAALALWTKESALYLLPCLIALIFAEKKTQASSFLWLAIGFILGFSPFAAISMLRYGNPIMPFVARLQQFRGSSRGVLFNFFFIEALPASIGLLTVPFYIDSFIKLLKQKKPFLPLISLFSLSFYFFLMPYGLRDQYMVHYTPLFMLTSALSLRQTVATCLRRYGLKGILVMVAVVLFTNMSPRSEDPYTWIFLHQRMMKIDKYNSIREFIASK